MCLMTMNFGGLLPAIDGEGQCTMEIEGYEELMRLEKEGKIEVPYSHGHDEILLYECKCGVTHEAWLESKN